MREELNFTVSQAEDGERLDKAVLQLSGRFTRSAVVKWIEDGNVLVGGVGKAKNYRVKTGDEIDVYVPEPVMKIMIFWSSINQRAWSCTRRPGIMTARSSMRFFTTAAAAFRASTA